MFFQLWTQSPLNAPELGVFPAELAAFALSEGALNAFVRDQGMEGVKTLAPEARGGCCPQGEGP